jgi:hypothetical protein
MGGYDVASNVLLADWQDPTPVPGADALPDFIISSRQVIVWEDPEKHHTVYGSST